MKCLAVRAPGVKHGTQAIHLKMTEGVPRAHEEVRVPRSLYEDRCNRLESGDVLPTTEHCDVE